MTPVLGAAPLHAAHASPISGRLQRVLASYWAIDDGELRLPPTIAARVRAEPRAGGLIAAVPPFAGRPSAFVKVFSNPTAFHREYDGLAAGHRLATGRVRVPAVLHRIDSEWALVTEHIQGPTLGHHLRKTYLTSGDGQAAAFESLGQWLASYHTSQPDGLPLHQVLDRIGQEVLEQVRRARPQLGPARYDAALRILEALVRDLRSADVPLGQCHYDLQPLNIIVRDGYLYVVDFAYTCTGLLEQDFVEFELSLRSNLDALLPFATAVYHRLLSAFLTGYGRRAPIRRLQSARDLFALQWLAVRGSDTRSPPGAGAPAEWPRRLWQAYGAAKTRRALRGWVDARAGAYGLA